MTNYCSYYAKYRRIVNKDTGAVRECYSPVVIIKGEEYLVSKEDKVMEFKNMNDALDKAEETYLKLKKKNEHNN